MAIPVKRYGHSSSSASGASFAIGVVLGVEGNVAQVRLNVANKIEKVRTDMMRSKGARVRAGETWILDQPYGMGWMFAVPMAYNGLDTAPSWVQPTLLGAWVNFSTPGTWTPGSGLYAPASYLLGDDGWVTLSGHVKSGTVSASSAAGPIAADIFQLPVGCRPGNAGQRLFSTYGAAAGAILVMPDGYVRAYAGNAAQVSLDGVRFLAEQ